MTEELRKALEAQRRTIAAQAARDLLEGVPTDSDALDEVARIDRVLGALPSPRRSVMLPAAIGLASITCVALAWLLPISALGLRTAFHLEAAAGAVGATPAENLEWRPGVHLAPAEARVTGEDVSGWSGLATTVQFATLTGEALSLQILQVPAGGTLDLMRAGPNGMEIVLQGPGASAELLVTGDGAIDGTAFTHPIPELLRLEAGDTAHAPVVMRLDPAEPLHLRAVPVTEIRFGVPDGSGGFVSSLQDATLRLPQTGDALSLGEADVLRTSGLDAQIIDLVAGPGAAELHLVLQGSAGKISVEQAGVLRTATPSVLYYLFNNERLAFLLGAISAIWGMMWSARRLFFS